jgi:hypothetical protein
VAQEAVMRSRRAGAGWTWIGRWTLVASLLGVLAVAVGVGAQGRGAALDVPAPVISGGPWINSAPLAPDALRGRVVFVEFWTYG